jgi:hypothetical protein
MKHNFFAIIILYRSVLGFSLSQFNEIEEATIVNFFIGLLFTLYIISDILYVKADQNWRSYIIQTSSLSALFVAMFYRSMKGTTSIVTRTSTLESALLIMIMLFCSVIVNLAILIYEFYEKFIKGRCILR